jgi:GAF domain-containing protein
MALPDDDALAHSLRELVDHLAPDAFVGELSAQLAAVVVATARLLGVESVGILLLDDADRVRSVAASGPAAEALETAQERVAVGPGLDALQGAMIAVPDVAAEPRYAPLWQEIADCGVRAVLAAPILLGAQVVGNLNAVVPDPHVWSTAQQRSAEAVAGIVAQMLGLTARSGSGTGGDDPEVAR